MPLPCHQTCVIAHGLESSGEKRPPRWENVYPAALPATATAGTFETRVRGVTARQKRPTRRSTPAPCVCTAADRCVSLDGMRLNKSGQQEMPRSQQSVSTTPLFASSFSSGVRLLGSPTTPCHRPTSLLPRSSAITKTMCGGMAPANRGKLAPSIASSGSITQLSSLIQLSRRKLNLKRTQSLSRN